MPKNKVFGQAGGGGSCFAIEIVFLTLLLAVKLK